jgi:hypothetical protein
MFGFDFKLVNNFFHFGMSIPGFLFEIRKTVRMSELNQLIQIIGDTNKVACWFLLSLEKVLMITPSRAIFLI